MALKDLKIKEKTSDIGEFFMEDFTPEDIDLGNEYKLVLVERNVTGNGNKEKTELVFKLST